MKTSLNYLVLVLFTATILAFTSGCADNYTFKKAACVLPNGQIGVQYPGQACAIATASELKELGNDR